MEDRLAQLEQLIGKLADAIAEVKHLVSCPTVVKEFYTTHEVARLLGKRPYTVREWCRLGRVEATKSHSGRGSEVEWRISHEELERIRNEGLLPLDD